MRRRTLLLLWCGTDRRCAPGTGCVKARQIHGGTLSSGSGLTGEGRHPRSGLRRRRNQQFPPAFHGDILRGRKKNNGGERGCNPEEKARVRTKLSLKRENWLRSHPLVIPVYSSNPVQKREREDNLTRSRDCSLRRGTSGMKKEREEGGGRKNPSCGALLCGSPFASALLLSVCCSSPLRHIPET